MENPFRDAAIILKCTDKYKLNNGYFREGLLFSKVVIFGYDMWVVLYNVLVCYLEEISFH